MTKTTTLWILFALFILETLGFGLIMVLWEFEIIDEMSDPEQIRTHIANLSLTQRHVHAWMTATLDVAYPLTYGPLFAGLALRRFRAIYSLPAWAVIPTDLAEGVVQVLALTGTEDVLWLKAYLTPTKLVFFILAGLIALTAMVRLVRQRSAANQTEQS